MRKKHILLLQEISRSIPEELVSKLMVQTKVSPHLESAVKRFLAGQKVEKGLAEQWKGKEVELKNLFDTGFFSKTDLMPDPKIEKQIEKYLSDRIDKAIEDGLLPKQSKKLVTKSKQYARRNTKKES